MRGLPSAGVDPDIQLDCLAGIDYRAVDLVEHPQHHMNARVL